MILVFFGLFYGNTKAQISLSKESQLTYKENESYNSITFEVESVNNQQDLDFFKKLLNTNLKIYNIDFDFSTKKCTIDAQVDISKKEIVDVCGRNGIKTSNYTEKKHLLIQMPKISDEDRIKMNSQRMEGNRIIDNWPKDFPRYIDTGNKEKDNQDYNQKKQEWIQKNPEKYKEISTSKYTYETENEKKDRLERENYINN